MDVQRALAARGVDLEAAVTDADRKPAKATEDDAEDATAQDDVRAVDVNDEDASNNITSLDARSRRDRQHEDR
jgi:hypothetical protein